MVPNISKLHFAEQDSDFICISTGMLSNEFSENPTKNLAVLDLF